MDLICRILEMIYYKTTPPPLFQKPFRSIKAKDEADVDLSYVIKKIDEYLAQEIARDNLDGLVYKLLEILLALCRGHRRNSEQTTKYFNVLYQHF